MGLKLRQHYMEMAGRPEELLLAARTMKSDADLTFIAEALGELPGGTSELLLRLLAHPSPVVREGALLGLSARPMNDAEERAVRVTFKIDPDPMIRKIAMCVLDETV